jgi:hypothetical protein
MSVLLFSNNIPFILLTQNRKKAALQLIVKGASFTAVNLDNFSPLTLACREDNWLIADILADRGSPIMPLYKVTIDFAGRSLI